MTAALYDLAGVAVTNPAMGPVFGIMGLVLLIAGSIGLIGKSERKLEGE